MTAFGIDLGTSNIKIYNSATDKIMNQKNIVAIANRNQLFSLGNEAFEAYEKAPANIRVSFPMSYGVIADFNNMQTILQVFIEHSGKGNLRGSEYYMAVPTDITDVEKRAFFDLVESSGLRARRVFLVEKALADGLGVGLDIRSARGTMMVNMGADTTEISIINLGGIVLSNGEVQAVRGVSFSVKKGEILGIVGESGSGKSVTSMSILRLLADTARIKEGKIVFDGTDLLGLSKKELRQIRGEKISMIFQDPMSSLNPLIPVGKQVAEMIREHHPDRSKEEIRKEVLALFEKVRIPEPERRYKCYPHEFSGGMRQRVMIAMALANKPELLIADEPTTALDVTIQDQILKQLRELEKEYGTSIIFITHDLGVVAELCDRVIVMYGGLVMEEASIFDIFEQPKHPYTMGLLASIPDLHQDKSVRLMPIPGSPPDMTNPPKGCPFAPRCPYARNICAAELPEFTEVGENHHSRCFLLYPDAPADENNPFRSKE